MGRAYVQVRTRGRIVVCLQDVMGAVVEMELNAERAAEFLESLEAALSVNAAPPVGLIRLFSE